MTYLTLDVLPDGCIKHKDWVCDAVCNSRFSNLIKFIVEEETKQYCHDQPERSKREDYKVTTINSHECPKIEMPIDKDILTKYKWDL